MYIVDITSLSESIFCDFFPQLSVIKIAFKQNVKF